MKIDVKLIGILNNNLNMCSIAGDLFGEIRISFHFRGVISDTLTFNTARDSAFGGFAKENGE